MAIGYKSRPTKLTLAITTQPTTTEYIVGDTLNLSGMVVTATRRDGTPVNVTSSCTFSPANGSSLSSSGTKTITITYHGKTITTTISVYALSRIAVTTAPTKTAYNVGETISYSGMVVKAYANNDNIVRTITSECTKSPAQGTTLSSIGSFSATISWRTKSTTQAYSVTALIYGAEWAGGSSSAWTRTDNASSFSNPSPAVNNGNGSSPFDNIMPWSGIQRVTESAGKVTQVLVKIPKFYYKWTRTGTKMKLQISMYKGSGFYTSPAHADRGDGKGERDYVYVGAYHSYSHIGTLNYTCYSSCSGKTPVISITRADARTNIHHINVGVTNDYWQWDIAMYWTICMLYLVEYADWNSQAKIGYGCGNRTSLETTGKTDAMTYHTGTNASNRNTAGHVRYRYIEDLWANVRQPVDGIRVNNNSIYIIKNPSSFSDTSNGINVGTMPSETATCQITSFSFNPTYADYGYYPIPSTVTTTTNFSTYTCDQAKFLSQTASTYIVGADYDGSEANGLFTLNAKMASDSYEAKLGCRLMKLP